MSNKERDDTQIQSMLRSEDKGISEATGVLSRLIRIIMCDRDITPMKYSMLMRKWLANTKDVTDILSERGNMNKEMYKPDITWASAIKALAFMRISRFRITIEAEWLDEPGLVTRHSLDVPNPTDFIVRRNRTNKPRKRKKQEDLTEE